MFIIRLKCYDRWRSQGTWFGRSDHLGQGSVSQVQIALPGQADLGKRAAQPGARYAGHHVIWRVSVWPAVHWLVAEYVGLRLGLGVVAILAVVLTLLAQWTPKPARVPKARPEPALAPSVNVGA
jgi:hypothetical protein